MATGQYPAFTAKIRPFYDRLDIEVEWLWYWVPADRPAVPTNVFVPRWWESREHWIPPGVGTVPGSERAYLGKLPAQDLGPLHGDPDWWLNGLSYARYIAGGYPEAPCFQLKPPNATIRIRQEQSVRLSVPHGLWLFQMQDLQYDALVSHVEMKQEQRVQGEGSQLLELPQAQDLAGPAVPPLLLQEAQDLGGPILTPLQIDQVQRVQGEGSQLLELPQAQDLAGPAVVPYLIEQVQDLGGPGLVSLMISQAQAPAIIV